MPILELDSRFRSALRAAAHNLRPVVQIGDKGLTDAVMKEVERALAAHGLIKVRVAGEDRAERLAVQSAICEALECAPVHHLGKVLILYRPTEADPKGHAFRPAINSVATIGVQPRKADEPHIPKKLAAVGKPAPARKRVERPVRESGPLTARERYLGSDAKVGRPTSRRSNQAAPTRSPARPGSALSLRAGARAGLKSSARPARSGGRGTGKK